MVQISSIFSPRNAKEEGMFRIWFFYEIFKLCIVLLIVIIPSIITGIIWYLVWVWMAFGCVFFYKTIPHFKEYLRKSINEENSELRKMFVKARNFLILSMASEFFPFFAIPQMIIKYLFFKCSQRIYLKTEGKSV